MHFSTKIMSLLNGFYIFCLSKFRMQPKVTFDDVPTIAIPISASITQNFTLVN